MRDYILPIPELKKIEPILTEYFGYKRAMFENELLATYYHEYPNGISEDICKNYMTDHSFLNTIAVDNGVFDYKRYAPKSTSTSKAFNPSSFIMDSEHNILVTLPSNNMLERLIDLLQKHGETDNDSVIGISLLVVAAIYEKYKNEGYSLSDYIFPILDKKFHITEIQQYDRIRKVTKGVNRNLKKIGSFLGLNIPLTTYVARHSFATVLKRSGVNVAIISEALGHTSLSTTQFYLDSFDNEQIDDAMKNLL